jgi:hypothetical protein
VRPRIVVAAEPQVPQQEPLLPQAPPDIQAEQQNLRTIGTGVVQVKGNKNHTFYLFPVSVYKFISAFATFLKCFFSMK